MIQRQALPAMVLLAALAPAMAGVPKHPGLSEKDWACAQTTSAAIQVGLTNAGLIDQTKVDNDKTEIKLLAKEPLPRGETRQVFLLTLHEPGGRTVSVITQSKTGGIPGAAKSDYECPYEQPKAYVVSKEL